MILLDTNVIFAVMAPTPPAPVLRWFDDKDSGALYLSTVTIAEIAYGIEILPDGRRRKGLVERFNDFVVRGFESRVLSFDPPAAFEYAAVMAHRRGIGRPMGVPDGQIAAIARSNQMAVATRNLRDFEECGLELLDPFAES